MARDAGVDTVKQWVAVLDARTRDSHQAVDGEWVEKDAKFSNGLRYPCDPNGSVAEVVNCRCKVAYLPRWYVEKNYPRLRRDNESGEIIECSNYAEYKEKYLKIADKSDIINVEPLSRYLNSSDKLYQNAKKVKALDGYEDIFIHGDANGFCYKNANGEEIGYYSPREFARILRNDPSYNGGDIRLFSCSTASDGAIAAQGLANQLGVNVLAPTKDVFIDGDGNIIIGTLEDARNQRNTGEWVLLTPKRKE